MWWQTALWVIGFLVLAPFVGGYLSGVDRVLSARFQGRQGPPVLQPFYDLAKLFSKQALIVNGVQDFLVIGYFVFSIFSGALFFGGGDLLLSMFALTLAEIFMFMAASSANSPFSNMGAQRELLQIMCYEPMLLLIAIGFYMGTGSFMVRDIAHNGFSTIGMLPGMFLGLLFVMIIKLRKSPFDLSTSHHAHQEMVKGMTTEISGNIYAFVELAEWYEDVLLLGIVALFILNRSAWSIPVALAVCAVVYFLEILIDNVFPRVKWKKMFGSAWFVALVFGGVNLLILNFI